MLAPSNSIKNAVLVFLLMSVACSSPSNKDDNEMSVDELKEQVMSIHDEVMPKMGELMSVRKKLLHLYDSLKVQNPKNARLYLTLAEEIENANKSMMDWMRNFDLALLGDQEKAKDYLREQRKKIKKVMKDMTLALTKGKKALEQKER